MPSIALERVRTRDQQKQKQQYSQRSILDQLQTKSSPNVLVQTPNTLYLLLPRLACGCCVVQQQATPP